MKQFLKMFTGMMIILLGSILIINPIQVDAGGGETYDCTYPDPNTKFCWFEPGDECEDVSECPWQDPPEQ